ncbi:MAG: sulfite exporter TauE/SafE family protein [Clostridia bacterium]|nr:sulfite exporter TauE/SafE family protein [Clostridia bacterium]
MKAIKFISFSILAGLVVGFVNGFLGAGGGMLLVPLLTYLFKMNTKVTHSTAVFVMMPICLISGLTYLFKGVVDYNILLPVALGTLVGGLIGSLFLKKLNSTWINYIFYFVMIGSGVWILIR